MARNARGAAIEAEVQPQAAWMLDDRNLLIHHGSGRRRTTRAAPDHDLERQLGPARLEGSRGWSRGGPDVLCLQETKVRNELFPVAEVEALGYPHHVLHGQAGYHGVAIVAKVPLADARPLDWCSTTDCRHLRASCRAPSSCTISTSRPAAICPILVNPKFRHKLEMLEALSGWFRRGFRARAPAVLAGDLNVAPLETNVWNHRALLRVVSHTPVEVEALAAAGLGALARRGRPVRAGRRASVSWWSYRARDWAAKRPRPPPRPRLGDARARPRLHGAQLCARPGVGRSPSITCRSRSSRRA